MVRPMVHSNKHYVQQSIATITGSAKLDIVIVDSVNATAANLVNEVAEGSTIKAVFIEMWIRAGETTAGSVIVNLMKYPGGLGVLGTAFLAAMGTSANKKNCLYFTQGLVNDQDADAIPFLRGWFKIPKSKQRFGLGDRLVLQIFAQGAIDLHICGFETYKEYS